MKRQNSRRLAGARCSVSPTRHNFMMDSTDHENSPACDAEEGAPAEDGPRPVSPAARSATPDVQNRAVDAQLMRS